MAGVLIGVILLFLSFFIITRRTWVRVIKDRNLEIQIHLPLLALYLTSTDKKKSKKQSQDGKLSVIAYIRIAAGVLSRFPECDVEIKRVILPCRNDRFDGFTLVRPFGYQGLVYAIIVYLKTKSKKLTLENNAIISSPDVTETQFYFTVKLPLYQLLFALLTIKRGVNKEIKRARGI